MTDSAATAAFKLSRIYAEGWNAASKLSANQYLDPDAHMIAASNPYLAEPQRARWAEGFAKALAGQASRSYKRTKA